MSLKKFFEKKSRQKNYQSKFVIKPNNLYINYQGTYSKQRMEQFIRLKSKAQFTFNINRLTYRGGGEGVYDINKYTTYLSYKIPINSPTISLTK